MQKIGQIASETLQQQLSNTENTVKAQEKNSLIPIDGSKMVVGKTSTAIEKSRQQGLSDSKLVAKAIQQMRSQPLYQIKADDPHREIATQAVFECLTPITYEESALEIGRWLMHYPRRHSDQDAIIIQDLADEFEVQKFGIGIVILSLREIRNEYRVRESGEENPWVPQTGYILNRIKENQRLYACIYDRLTRPEVPAISAPEKKVEMSQDPYEGKFWAQFEDYEREDCLKELIGYNRTLRRIFLNLYHAPLALMENEAIEKSLGRTT